MKFKKSFLVFGWGALFGCMFLSGLLLYSDVLELPRTSKTLPVRLETFPIKMKVDFGPARKAGYEKTIYVEKGTTLKEAVSRCFPFFPGEVVAV